MWESRPFGCLKNGKECKLFTYKTDSGVTISVTDYGISLVSFIFPDGVDVLLGFDDVSGYESHDFYSGCIVGRVAGRIAEGKFSIDEEEYQLTLNNNGDTHLHGGFTGLSKVVWDCEVLGEDKLRFSHFQPDGIDGYPGSLTVSVDMSVRKRTVGGRVKGTFLSIDMRASCDKPTPINLTFHPYFNMSGEGSALEDKLTIYDYAGYIEMNPDTILPTGEIIDCRGTAFEFRDTPIGEKMGGVSGGYDHTFALLEKEGWVVPAAEIAGEGRRVKVHTDQRGIHVYSGNFLDGTVGKGGVRYEKHAGVALEAQNFPNAINVKGFPDCVLRPGEEYKRNITFTFESQS